MGIRVRQLGFFLFGALGASYAHAGGPPAGAHPGGGSGQHHHHPPIHHSGHAHMMPSHIQAFNASSQLAAANLMDATARAALQAQANSLAAQYKGLQGDANGGNFDTSGMGDMMKGFAGNVNDVKLPETHEVTPAPGLAPTPDNRGASQNSAQGQNVAIIVQSAAPAAPSVPAPPAPPESPVDATVAQASEQIIPDLQTALNVSEGKVPAASAPGANSGSVARASDSALALVPIAAAGDRKDLAFDMPPGVEMEHAHSSSRDLASSGDVAGGDFAGESPAVGSSGEAGSFAPQMIAGQGASEGLPTRGLPLDVSPKKELPKNLLAKVKRVQCNGACGDAPEKGGFFQNLKNAFFGQRAPKKSSFYRPLDFPKQPVEASFGDYEEEGDWWQPLALPVGFTLLFCGIVWRMNSRKRSLARGRRLG